ncbi:hypothetical protein ACE1B6_06565 [Aerosakkonemataceae cyanobacterium BLCC-F154]|uniref:Uncharacterized protein n=1 Tax=Floridaenema fluviatile BLCC-F154 TaxID=3153640 RepID=A0ABV4Y7Z6_9CYAN
MLVGVSIFRQFKQVENRSVKVGKSLNLTFSNPIYPIASDSRKFWREESDIYTLVTAV